MKPFFDCAYRERLPDANCERQSAWSFRHAILNSARSVRFAVSSFGSASALPGRSGAKNLAWKSRARDRRYGRCYSSDL